ncbi:helix-turn-helix domain-containing protein [Streptomyces sp. LX-29]|uniref:NACHT domain-containing protein n=1 Tax=Streptomyces sp. LX-29 TaxID=2900152 RepID=UPI00240DA6DE|nr:NACHT domain-containing protein [Streptomyces sp. LX-29]WFB11324.1 helix-turn-helix domain-containing protein [Streptomyces sp. LX-29]
MADAEPNGANRELKRRLKAAMDRQGLSQADIVRRTERAGEAVSKATVNNALNPEKGPPSSFTLKAILKALGISDSEREELSRLRGAHSRGTARLEMYLETAQKAARQHPYPSVLDAPNLPALADVYVRQQARTPAADNQAGPVVPAAEVFGEDRAMCVLLGGPGGGKSTLLRAHLANSADGWLSGTTSKTIPVMVNATALTGTDLLPTALANAVSGDLRQVGLLDELGTDFFRHPPRPGTSWLVLVDGLDEIPDADTRSAVLTMLASATSAGTDLYRFVVATRPLPARELSTLGRHAPRYELQPFSRDDLLTYATHWFRALDDPGRHAVEFMAGLARSRLKDMARTPLMAFMLCQLYAADPARPLPDGRAGAYESFVELIYEQNAHKNIRSTHDGAIRLLKDRHQIPQDNQAAEQAAQRVRNHLPELIDLLAHARISGNIAPAVEVLVPHLHAQRPHKVKEPLWNAFLGNLLRPTGLLAQRAGDFEFRSTATVASVPPVPWPAWMDTVRRASSCSSPSPTTRTAIPTGRRPMS